MPLTDNPTALLAQILAHPRVKAYGEARGWWESACPKCGYSLWIRGVKIRVSICRHCRYESRDDDPTPLPQLYTGPDLALPANLHELLGLADAMNESGPVEITRSGIDGVYTFHTYLVTKDEQGRLILDKAHGPTRTLAVIAALGRALGIEETS